MLHIQSASALQDYNHESELRKVWFLIVHMNKMLYISMRIFDRHSEFGNTNIHICLKSRLWFDQWHDHHLHIILEARHKVYIRLRRLKSVAFEISDTRVPNWKKKKYVSSGLNYNKIPKKKVCTELTYSQKKHTAGYLSAIQIF